MGKYAPLGRLLAKKGEQGQTRVELTFDQIEAVIPGQLPASASEHRAWWANTATSHVQAQEGWLESGWKVDSTDLETETVVFEQERTISITERDTTPRDISTKETWLVAANDAAMNHYQAGLHKRTIDPVPKPFPLVNEDETIVGDKTYAKMLKGGKTPYAVHSTISETVWLLQNTDAEHRFIIFGNDRRVPQTWIDRFGHLANGITFHYLETDGQLEVIKPEAAPRLVDDANDATRTGVDP